MGLRGRKRRWKRTGVRLIDDLLTRTAARGWSLVDLDVISGTRRYFQRQNWRYNRLSGGALLKAIEALDGEITITWCDS